MQFTFHSIFIGLNNRPKPMEHLSKNNFKVFLGHKHFYFSTLKWLALLVTFLTNISIQHLLGTHAFLCGGKCNNAVL